MLIGALFNYIVKNGRLTVIDAKGRAHIFGPDPEPAVTIRLHDSSLEWRLFFQAPVLLGEAYMDGRLTIEQGGIEDLLSLLLSNLGNAPAGPIDRWRQKFKMVVRRLDQYNPVRRAKRNVAHHYDLSDVLYDNFLDPDRQYSCAYFRTPQDTLAEAQDQKKRHIAGKLLLKPDQRVLDIGSGWGGLALTLAEFSGARLTGITLSEEQLKVARARARALDMDDRVEFALRDYRQQTGKFDRIVSVGMFEHVGVNHFGAFFRKVRDLLADDGVALIHTIGRSDGPGSTSPWIRKYIFPGGYCPALSEVLPAIERSGLFVTDVEVLRLHYAETLRAWRDRFRENWEKIKALYDERFCRMWEFYLAGSEMAFRYQAMVVFQIQIAKRVDTVPLTRDYIVDWERAHAPTNVTQLPGRGPARLRG
jgi:cyclopropane-fatty-acyl-phospholipid synthase